MIAHACSRISIGVVAGIVFAASGNAAAQSPQDGAAAFTVDRNLAKQGKSLWTSKMCSGCHTIGKGRSAGPDVAHILERREPEWVRRWLKDPEAMYAADATAQALLKEYNNLKMPNMKLTDEQVEQLLHYMMDASPQKK